MIRRGTRIGRTRASSRRWCTRTRWTGIVCSSSSSTGFPFASGETMHGHIGMCRRESWWRSFSTAPAYSPDYKFFVFHGHAKMIQVDFDRFTNHTRCLYTPAWGCSPSSTNGTSIRPESMSSSPSALPEMLRVAERLGAETDFVRVDLYCIRERVVVGELTRLPGGRARKVQPARVRPAARRMVDAAEAIPKTMKPRFGVPLFNRRRGHSARQRWAGLPSLPTGIRLS